MNWFIFSVLGTFLSASVNFVDKYLVEKHLSDSRVMIIYSALCSGILGTVLFILIGKPIPPLDVLFMLLLAGVLVITATLIYFNVIVREHVSFIVLFFQILPIFIMIEGFIFLGERLTTIQLLGSSLIIISSSALIWTDHNDAKFAWKISIGSLLGMLAFDVLWALSVLCIKLASTQVSFAQIIAIEHIGIALGGTIIFLVFRPIRISFLRSLQRLKRPVLLTIFLNEGVLLIAAKTSLDYAYTIGIIGLVSIVDSLQILFVVVLGFILTSLAPRIFKENVQKRVVFRKTIYILFMIIGVKMIT